MEFDEKKRRRLSAGWSLKDRKSMGVATASAALSLLPDDMDENDDASEKVRLREAKARDEARRKSRALADRGVFSDEEEEEEEHSGGRDRDRDEPARAKYALHNGDDNDNDNDAENRPQASGGRSKRQSASPNPNSARSPLSDIGNRGTVTQTAVGVGASERKDKSGTAPLIGTVSDANKPRLTNSQRAALYAECIKLASANKITVKNTWSLDLIDHMNDVLENEEIDDHAIAAAVGEDYDGPAPVAPVTSSNKAKTKSDSSLMNFQRASCTLDASVKIYSYRVDSVHKDTYKVLGGMNRTDDKGAENSDNENGGDKAESGADNDGESAGQLTVGPDGQPLSAEEEAKQKRTKKSKKESGRPSVTLESNEESLNVRKLEREFEIDPLFKKMSAAFDEGGARGLLLNNLSVREECALVFDSSDASLRLLPSLARPSPSAPPRPVACASACAGVPMQELRAIFWSAQGGRSLASLPLCGLLDEMFHLADQLRSGHDAVSQLGKTRAETETDTKRSAAACASDAESDLPAAADWSSPKVPAPVEAEALRAMSPTPLERAPAAVLMQLGEDQDDDDDNEDCYSIDAGPAGDSSSYFHQDDVSGPRDGDGEMVPAQPVHSVLAGRLKFAANDEFSYFEDKSFDGWAGASHWKFRARKVANTAKAKSVGGAEDTSDSDKTKAGRKRKAPFSLDFHALLRQRLPEATFAPPPRSANVLSEKQKAASITNTLPVDIHFGARRLQSFFTRPRLALRLRSVPLKVSYSAPDVPMGAELDMDLDTVSSESPQLPTHVDLNSGLLCVAQPEPAFGDVCSHGRPCDEPGMALLLGMDGGAGAASDDEAEDSAGAGEPLHLHGARPALAEAAAQGMGQQQIMQQLGLDLFEQPQAQGELQLVSRPNTVEKIDINYAKFAKKVDVKALKQSLWSSLVGRHSKPKSEAGASATEESKEQRAAGPEALDAPHSFQDAISSLKSSLPSDVLPNISVSFCFICLLHLANENDLTLQPLSAPADPCQPAGLGLGGGDDDGDVAEVAAEAKQTSLGDFAVYTTKRSK